MHSGMNAVLISLW